MRKSTLFFYALALTLIIGLTSELKAQNGPVLYFCERYGASGEVGIGDRFYTGPVTVMVKCDYALGLRDCSIQLDRYNGYSFDYYKKVNFSVTPDMNYIYFSDPELRVDSPGIYRCFLLDSRGNNVASSLIEFIR
ncbi:MAG: hypothetical protein N2510_05205 [Ignavibacteria bacterium]|nr:hypothetical protein [Ignavibacteria bacterium]